MARIFISADSLLPSNHAIETSYFYSSTAVPIGPPVEIDTAGHGQQATLLPASNTAMVFAFGASIYRLLNRQQSHESVMCVSTDNGATWAVLDSTHNPPYECLSGFYDAATGRVMCAFNDTNGAAGHLRLIAFDLSTGLWGTVNPTVGPAVAAGASLGVWVRSDTTVLVLYQSRTSFGAGDPSGLGGVSYDPIGNAWSATFDVGAHLLALAGWDATQTLVHIANLRAVLDPATGIVHAFFTTTSLQTVPVVWGNRVFYQQVLLNNTCPTTSSRFSDFPGQVAPFPAFPYNTQQLTVYSGPPFGNPVIIGDYIFLPVAQRNDSVIDRFPVQIPSVYSGTPVAAPVWTLAAATIDPGVLVDDFIWIQQAPEFSYDGTNLYAVYSAQDEDGQNLARIRLLTYTAGVWSGQTAFDLQVDAPAGFNFATQFMSAAGAFAAPALAALTYANIDASGLGLVYLPDPARCS